MPVDPIARKVPNGGISNIVILEVINSVLLAFLFGFLLHASAFKIPRLRVTEDIQWLVPEQGCQETAVATET